MFIIVIIYYMYKGTTFRSCIIKILIKSIVGLHFSVLKHGILVLGLNFYIISIGQKFSGKDHYSRKIWSLGHIFTKTNFPVTETRRDQRVITITTTISAVYIVYNN